MSEKLQKGLLITASVVAVLLLLVGTFLMVSYANDTWPFSSLTDSQFRGMMAESVPAIYDYEGNVRDVGWMFDEFGTVSWTPASAYKDKVTSTVFKLIELRAQCDYATLKVVVLDENGSPLPGVNVVRYWPGAPPLPDFSNSTASQWTTVGVYGATGADGAIGFGMGTGDYYFADTQMGVSSIYVASLDGYSDWLLGLGMLGGTNHCHLDSVFQRVSSEEPPTPVPPTPTPGPTSETGIWDINITIQGTIEKR